MMINSVGAVLLPIDMQQGFDFPPWPKRWNADAEENGRQLLAAFRRRSLPIIHVRHDSVVEGSVLAVGHAGNRFRDGFEPQNGEPVVSKSVNGAFIGTDLELRLKRLGAKTIVTFGISTDMCVSTTVRLGSNLGWNMLLAHDACDCFELTAVDGTAIPAKQIHEAHVATIAVEFCKVATTTDILKDIE